MSKRQLTVNHAIVGEAISVYGAPEDLSPRVVTPADLPECDVLALDCEGAEIVILRNLKFRPRAIAVESHGIYGAPSKMVRELLEQAGLRGRRLRRGGAQGSTGMRRERHTRTSWKIKQALQRGGKATIARRYRDGCVLPCYVSSDLSDFTWAPLNRPHVSVVTYYRLNMHTLLPPDIERVIYIDSDTIVVDSLEKLWNIDIGSKPIAGCADAGGITQSIRLNLPSSHKYFNAGVLIFNLAELRKSKMLDDAVELYHAREKEIVFQDQDILNILFCNRTYTLPLRWNINDLMFRYSYIRPIIRGRRRAQSCIRSRNHPFQRKNQTLGHALRKPSRWLVLVLSQHDPVEGKSSAANSEEYPRAG